ncbi:MAG: hypothetical protein WCI43_05935 [Candidatus Firestonebacteria bacterium]
MKNITSHILALLLLCGLAFSVSAEVSSEKEFRIIGIGGAGGMYKPTVSPFDPKLMFVTCDMGGAYRSLDGGKSWEMIHWRQITGTGGSGSRAYFAPGKIYWSAGNRLLVSEDKGAEWKTPYSGEAAWGKAVVTYISGLADSPETLFVGTGDGLYRSADSGGSWKKIRAGKCFGLIAINKNVFAFLDVLIASKDGGETWQERKISGAETQGLVSLAGAAGNNGNVILFAASSAGIIRSADEGRNWTVKEKFNNIDDLLMPQGQVNIVYSSQNRASRTNEVRRTKNGGETWECVFRMGKNVERSWVQTQLSWGYYISPLGLGISSTDPSVAMVTTQGDFYITRNGGESWQQLMNNILGVKAGDPGVRYQCNGLEVTSCWDYLFDPFDYNKRFIAYTDIGFGRSVDADATWSWSASGCPWGNTFYKVLFDPKLKGRMYAATSNRHDIPHWTHIDANKSQHAGGVCISKDNGLTWKVLGTGLPKLPCTYICFDPRTASGPLTFYTTLYEGGVWKSVDGGETWVNKSKGLGLPGNLHAYMVKVHPKTGEVFCSITANRSGNKFPVPGGLWKSADGGESWIDLTAELGLRWPAGFAFNPEDPNIIYFTAATIPGGREGGVYKTTDGGKSWVRVLKDEDFAATGGASYVHCLFINLHPEHPEMIYAGTAGHGLWYSGDSGSTWKRFEELPFSSAQNVTFDPKDPTVMYVTTFGGGIWKGNYKP